MVEHNEVNLDLIFKSLADSTRRDILRRVSIEDLSISSLAQPYKMSFAAIAKHVHILELAKLISKRRDGKQQIISVSPKTFDIARMQLDEYEKIWQSRFETLDLILENDIS